MHFKNLTTHFFLTLGFMLVSMNGTSQDRDSLENLLRNRNLPASTYLNICDELSWSYLNDDFGKAKLFALKGIEKARSENNLNMEASLYRNLGVAYYMNSQMDSAQLWLNRSLDLAMALKDEKLEAAVYGAIGNLHNVTGAYQEALSYYLKALSMHKSQGNKERIRSLLGNIGTLYHSLLNMSQAEKYYLELEKESQSAGDTYNLGRAYDGLSRIALREKDFDKSLGYSISAAEIFHNSNQQLEEAIALQGIAMVYYSHYRDYPTAKEYALRALKLTQENGYPAHVAGSLNILSNIHFNEKDYLNCRQTAREAIRIDTTDANVTSNLYANMVRSGIFLDNNEEALHYFDKYRALIDERSTTEFERSMAEQEKKYLTANQEMRISALEQERKLFGILLFSGLFILLLLLLLLWLRQKAISSEKKLAEQKIVHLEQEKQIVATQSILDGETAERTRLARDLHDGLGGMLSAVKLNLFDMRQDVIIETDDVERFNQVIEMLDNSMRELRRVAHNMMPESLSRYGLKVALEDFCHSLPKVTFHYFGEDQRIDHKLENTLYRAVFELINNAIRHAEAEHINVQLIQQADRVSVTVQDDGKGFEPGMVSQGAGLKNVQNRIGSAGGTVDIHSVTGQGTEITLEIDL